MASVNTQKTDPLMEPKLKAVDWDKVGTGQGGVMIGGSWGQGESAWRQRLCFVLIRDIFQGGVEKANRSRGGGGRGETAHRGVFTPNTPEGGLPQSLGLEEHKGKFRRSRHTQLDQPAGQSCPQAPRITGRGGE